MYNLFRLTPAMYLYITLFSDLQATSDVSSSCRDRSMPSFVVSSAIRFGLRRSRGTEEKKREPVLDSWAAVDMACGKPVLVLLMDL